MSAQRGRKPASSRKSTGGRKTSNKKQESFSTEVKDEVILLSAIAITILLFLCNFHIIGKAGDAVSNVMFGLFGLLAYIAPPALFFACLFGVINLGNRTATVKLWAAVVLFVDVEIILALLAGVDKVGESVGNYYSYATEHTFSGGVIGASLARGISGLIGIVGTIVVVLIVMILCLVLLTEKSFVKGVAGGGRRMYETARDDLDRRIVRNEEMRESRMQQRSAREQEKEDRKKRRMEQKVSGVSVDTAIPKNDENEMGADIHEVQDVREHEYLSEQEELDRIQIKGLTSREPAPEAEMQKRVHKVKVLEEDTVDMDKLSATLEADADKLAMQEIEIEKPVVPVKKKPYKKPPLSLLKKNENGGGGNSEKQLKETAMQLKKTLQTFGVNVTITDISQGPAVTRYELQPEMGVKVSKIVNLSDDIKLNLAATDIRIEAPIPGKAAIGIEVPNKENSMVVLRDLFETQDFKNFQSNIAFAVGKDIA
nr:DNA translocase FtsK 4TM domain-containing protein [Lachnospiraceae bacterium]